MPKCKDCLFWGAPPLDGRFGKESIKCRLRELERHGIKVCGRIQQTDLMAEGLESYRDEPAGLEATGGNHAYLFTRGDFGCSAHCLSGKARVRKNSSIRPCKRGKNAR